MRPLLCHVLALCCVSLASPAWAQDSAPASTDSDTPTASRPLIWSGGVKLKMEDVHQPGQWALRPIIGLRWGRWRAGPVDGESWYRFGQVRTDNSLTYDWLDTARIRTSLSASIVNLQKDATLDALEPGFKTLRGKATIDYLANAHWSVGLLMTQDLLGRGAGTVLSPGLTYRQALSHDSTLLLSQSLSWTSAQANATSHRISPNGAVRQGAGWSSLDSSLTLRLRHDRHMNWYAQLNRSQTIGTLYPTTSTPERSIWSTQIGLIYFGS